MAPLPLTLNSFLDCVDPSFWSVLQSIPFCLSGVFLWFFVPFGRLLLNLFTRLLFTFWPSRRLFLWPLLQVTESAPFMPCLLIRATYVGNLRVFVLCQDLILLPKISLHHSTQSVEIFLPAISSFSSVEADRVWCPVRALKWYLDRTKTKRSSPSLFVSSIGPFKAISKASIARWLVECITLAGPEALVSDRFWAHDTRSVSSSWALFNGASLKDIQQAAFWSSPNTFISCYLKDVLAAEASFTTSVLKTSVSFARGTSVSSSAPATSK